MHKFTIKNNNLQLTVHMPVVNTGVMGLINSFGCIWIGNINSKLFSQCFNDIKKNVLPNLANLSSIEDDSNLRIGHKLDLCHQALETNQWRSPITATCTSSEIFWESGQSRILAGGLCWDNAYQNHLVLLASPSYEIAANVITNPVEITNDEELSRCIGNNTNATSFISTRISNDNGQLNFRLGAVQQPASYHDYLSDLDYRVETVRRWVTSYPKGSRLDVYTNNPEKIVDSIGYFNINFAGSGLSLDQPVWIDSELHKLSGQHGLDTPDGHHELYVSDSSSRIDVAELLFWADMRYTAYNTKDWRFVFRRQSSEYRSKTIGLSRS